MSSQYDQQRDVCDAVTDITFPVSADDIRLGLYTKALGKLGVPTAKDVAELTRRVEELSAAVARLSKSGKAPAATKTTAAKAPAKRTSAAKKK